MVWIIIPFHTETLGLASAAAWRRIRTGMQLSPLSTCVTFTQRFSKDSCIETTVCTGLYFSIAYTKVYKLAIFKTLRRLCRDPGDTTSKVSCCVEPSWCYKNSNFDASIKVPYALRLKISLSRKQKYGIYWKCLFHRNYAFTWRFDSYTFKKKPRLHFGQSFILKYFPHFDSNFCFTCSRFYLSVCTDKSPAWR